MILAQNVNILTPCGYVFGNIYAQGNVICKIEGQKGRREGKANLFPGLFDIHTHGAMGFDFNSANEQQMEKMLSFYASCGTTSLLATIMTDNTQKMLAQLAVTASVASKNKLIKGIHLEGPFLSEKFCGAQPKQFLLEPNIELFERFQDTAQGLIRYVTIAPEAPCAMELIEYLTKKNVKVSLGHSGANFDTTKRAFLSGAVCFTHFLNAMPDFDQNASNIVNYAYACTQGKNVEIADKRNGKISLVKQRDDDFAKLDTQRLPQSSPYVELIADGKHIHKNALNCLIRPIEHNKIIAVTDSIAVTGLSDGRYDLSNYQVDKVGNDAFIANTKIRAGSTLTAFEALKNMCQFCSLDVQEAIKFQTVNPFNMFGLHQYGCLEEGKVADMFLEEKGKVTSVFCEGKPFSPHN